MKASSWIAPRRYEVETCPARMWRIAAIHWNRTDAISDAEQIAAAVGFGVRVVSADRIIWASTAAPQIEQEVGW